MATYGADFKRRVKYHGLTYTEIKNGSDLATIAAVSVAGLARELSGNNAIPGFRELVLTAVDCLQSIFVTDGQSLKDLNERLDIVAARHGKTEAQRIVVESLVREAGNLRGEIQSLGHPETAERLKSACGRDLHDGLVIAYADEYAMHHRSIVPSELPAFRDSWQKEASGRLSELMSSLFEHGRPERNLTRPRPDLAPVSSDSFEALTSIDLTR